MWIHCHMVRFTLFHTVLCMLFHSGEPRYEGYQLIRVHSGCEEARRSILQLEKTQQNMYDIWSVPRTTSAPFYLSVAPEGLENLKNLIGRYNLSYTILQDDLSKEIARQSQRRYVTQLRRTRRSLWRTEHDAYRTVEEIYEAIDRHGRQHSFVNIETLGYTEEGRPLKSLFISKDKSKPIIWIDAGIHAREWIAPAAALYFVDRLLTRTGQALLRDYQFHILPLVNPDGYAHTHRVDRLWRKNRSHSAGERCLGVDLNRNFPLKWGTGDGSSPQACTEVYRGIKPASELETQGIIHRLTELRGKLILYLSLHSFGQYILTPYGFARYQYPKNYKNMINMGHRIRKAIRERHGFVYQVGSSSDLLYEAAGGSDDFVAGELGVQYAYTIELCDEGRYGFLLPPSYIRSVGRQLWTAVQQFVEHM
ncbi:Subfamily M14A unassigned peptidase [Fasciola hepatica]|uniref:Subfamily M14A unassigned peptidase n=1 Tax=Fasciola hepatica TaxID=6192 RepID=A0A4E0RXH6_FASHE|nr:Subfamily M14A unassigned peptidase [Fasciola hepatica]